MWRRSSATPSDIASSSPTRRSPRRSRPTRCSTRCWRRSHRRSSSSAAPRLLRREKPRGVKGLIAAAGRERTAARPGPGPITAESLEALELAIARRVDGLLAGDYRSAFTGLGTELHQVRPYEPGDDVRRIDWNVTARTGTTHVRVELAERVLVTWLVFDASASMDFGTTERRKADVAEGVALAIGHAATRRGNRLGLVTFGPADQRWR